MGKKIQVWLDEELQIIRQKLIGNLVEEDALQLVAETAQYAAKLKNPSKVLILVDGRLMQKGTSRARKVFSEQQKRPDFIKLATWGMSPIARTIIQFVNMATGVDKMKVFKDEKSALEWLMK
jgi:hypothetical protein